MAALAGVIRFAALLASGVLTVSFTLFVVDQAAVASDAQTAKLGNSGAPAPAPTEEADREARHGQARELVDDANDVLVAPFAPLVEGQPVWAARLVTGVLGLLLWGVLLAIGANYLRK